MPAFFYHYNKPASRKLGRPVLTLHYRGRCIPVGRIVCAVPTETRNRPRQPHVVVAGRGTAEIVGDVAYITPGAKP